MSRKEQDIKRLIASKCHLGHKTAHHDMQRYISHRGAGGAYIINLEETWQKIKLAARAIVAVRHQGDVMVISSRPAGQRPVIKFASYTGAISTKSSRWTPGTLTNQSNQKAGKFLEPQLLIVTDPAQDKQAIVEASYVNLPVIALVNTENSLQYVDIAIPCNNRSTESISMIYWLLAREVMILRGKLRQDEEWDVLVDLFYHREISNDQLLVEEAPKREVDVQEDDQEQVTEQKQW